MLKIDEAGLNDLVNKFIREKIQKEESRDFADTNVKSNEASLPQEQKSEDEKLDSLFNKDEFQERAIVRSLLEFGLKKWEEEITVAEYIFEQMDDNDLVAMIENQVLVQIIDTYRSLFNKGENPTKNDFLYYEDQVVSRLVISLMDTQTEISARWKEHLEGDILTREDLFKEEVISTLAYFKLRKIKKLIDENQKELENSTVDADQYLYLKTHVELKLEEQQITKQLGTVIFK